MSKEEKSAEILATLLMLSKRSRNAENLKEMQFLLVNETFSLLSYSQAAFWNQRRGVLTVSGTSSLNKTSPYVQWLNTWFLKTPNKEKISVFQTDLNSIGSNKEWQEWLPRYLAVIIVPSKVLISQHVLILARNEPFLAAELSLLEQWIEIWSTDYSQKLKKSRMGKIRFSRLASMSFKWVYRSAVFLLVLFLSQYPIKLSILAPAELISQKPNIITAPINGIIKTIHFEPNQFVSQGDLLIEYERASSDNELDVARSELATAVAEYQQLAQRSLFDKDSKSALSIELNKVTESRIKVDYLQKRNQRSSISAPSDGVVLIDNVVEWLGKPTLVGEKILIIADPVDVLVEAWISPKDMVEISLGSVVTMYLEADPTNKLSGEVSYLAYQPQLKPDGTYGYRVRAKLNKAYESARLGLKGTARLEGPQSTFLYWVFRKPWASFRGWVGL